MTQCYMACVLLRKTLSRGKLPPMSEPDSYAPPTAKELHDNRPVTELENEHPWRQEAQSKGARSAYLSFLLARVPQMVQALLQSKEAEKDDVVASGLGLADQIWNACHQADVIKQGPKRQWWRFNYREKELKKGKQAHAAHQSNRYGPAGGAVARVVSRPDVSIKGKL